MQFKVLFQLFNYTSHYGTHHITTHIEGGFPPRPWFVPGWPASWVPFASGPLGLSPFGCGHPIWGLRPSPARMGLQMSQRCAASGLRYCGGYEWHGCPGSLFASGSWGTLLGLPILIMKHICDKDAVIITLAHLLPVQLLIQVSAYFPIYVLWELYVCFFLQGQLLAIRCAFPFVSFYYYSFPCLSCLTRLHTTPHLM